MIQGTDGRTKDWVIYHICNKKGHCSNNCPTREEGVQQHSSRNEEGDEENDQAPSGETGEYMHMDETVDKGEVGDSGSKSEEDSDDESVIMDF